MIMIIIMMIPLDRGPRQARGGHPLSGYSLLLFPLLPSRGGGVWPSFPFFSRGKGWQTLFVPPPPPPDLGGLGIKGNTDMLIIAFMVPSSPPLPPYLNLPSLLLLPPLPLMLLLLVRLPLLLMLLRLLLLLLLLHPPHHVPRLFIHIARRSVTKNIFV